MSVIKLRTKESTTAHLIIKNTDVIDEGFFNVFKRNTGHIIGRLDATSGEFRPIIDFQESLNVSELQDLIRAMKELNQQYS
jgi:hypothetical protein